MAVRKQDIIAGLTGILVMLVVLDVLLTIGAVSPIVAEAFEHAAIRHFVSEERYREIRAEETRERFWFAARSAGVLLAPGVLATAIVLVLRGRWLGRAGPAKSPSGFAGDVRHASDVTVGEVHSRPYQS